MKRNEELNRWPLGANFLFVLAPGNWRRKFQSAAHLFILIAVLLLFVLNFLSLFRGSGREESATGSSNKSLAATTSGQQLLFGNSSDAIISKNKWLLLLVEPPNPNLESQEPEVEVSNNKQQSGNKQQESFSRELDQFGDHLEQEANDKRKKNHEITIRRRRKKRSSLEASGFPVPQARGFSRERRLSRLESMRFVLMCQVLDSGGEGQVQIRWFKEQEELSQEAALRGKLPDQLELLANEDLGSSSLLFRRVQPQHSGNYTCLASNQFGSTSYSSQMSVKVDHVEQQQPSAQQVANFKLINSNHHVQTLENGSLTIRQVNREHEGLYLCEADNGVEPNLVKSLRLIIHLQAQFADEILVLEQQPGNQQRALMAPVAPPTSGAASGQFKLARVALGTSQLKLLCQPMGEPPLSVEWLKDGQPIYAYTMPPEVGGPLQHDATSGEQQVSSLTATTVNNYHVSTRRSQQRPISGLESELVMVNLRRQDAGLFSCVARNAYAQAERRLKLLVQEPPEPPEVVDVAHVGSRTIALRWLAPFDGNSPILKYTVEYRKSDEAQESSEMAQLFTGQSEKLVAGKTSTSSSNALVPVQQTATSGQHQQVQVQHTVHELEPLTRYTMRVVAHNSVGKSRPSIALSLRTDEEVPSVVPSFVEATVLSSKSIKLRWSITYSLGHEIIDGFFIGYRSLEQQPLSLSPASSSGAPQATNNRPQSSLSGFLQPTNAEQQQQQQTYTYKTIRLTNQQQQQSSGQLQPEVAASPNGNDQQQLKEQSDSWAFLSPISSITKTLPVPSTPSFNLQQQPTTTAITRQQVVVSSAFEYVISGLERSTEYTILIQCFNRKGAGPTSDPLVFKTFMNDPPEKVALSADEITESSLRLNWRFLSPERSSVPQNSRSSDQQQQRLVDGFVLTFAKVASAKLHHQQQHRMALNTSGSSVIDNHEPAARISNELSNEQQTQLQPPVDQWQAIQLAPQQRSHLLKNLECGTSYLMKIWAFNKIGNGEASDLMTFSTRGNAPVAPDKRSFVSVNSTQLRLHLSAWYDGGCEIDKFVVKYRARGQLEWHLLSSNIVKEQTFVLIKDLAPATGYELLVAAKNQVATTEARYRVITLDADGKQPSAFLGGVFSGVVQPDDFENDDISGGGDRPADYTMDADGTRRWPDRWPQEPSSRSMALIRHLLGSPTALAAALCVFVGLLVMAILYRLSSFNGQQLASGGGSHGNGGGGNKPRSMGCAGEASMLDGESVSRPLNLTGNAGSSTSSGDSPHLLNRLAADGVSGFQTAPSECQYQPYCGASIQHPVNQQVDYGRTMDTANPNNQPFASGPAAQSAAASYANYSLGPGSYASVQHGASLDLDSQSDQRRRQQQCLMQMLLMGSQQQQQQQPQPQQSPESSCVAALATMARGAGNKQLVMSSGQQLALNNQSPTNGLQLQQQLYSNATLGRNFDPQVGGYLRSTQPSACANGLASGKQPYDNENVPLLMNSNNHDATHQSNHLFADNSTDHNNNNQPQQMNSIIMTSSSQQDNNSNRPDELYPMSTFKRSPANEYPFSYCGTKSSLASTSGRGTATSGSSAALDSSQSDQISMGTNNFVQVNQPSATRTTGARFAGRGQFQNSEQVNETDSSYVNGSDNLGSRLVGETCFKEENLNVVCDKQNNHNSSVNASSLSQYDVPFKFAPTKIQPTSSKLINVDDN